MVRAPLILVLPVFASLVVYAQDAEMEDYDTEVVSEWSSGEYLSDLNQQCKTDCDRVCLADCPIAKLCKEDEIDCGVWHLPPGVWPGCTKDQICVPKGCECEIPGLDGSVCPMWCEIHCNENQIKCSGKKDKNGCKEADVCIDRPIKNDGTLCPGYCPAECNLEEEISCPSPPEDGCPKAPRCEKKQTDLFGRHCAEQHCKVTCMENEKYCPGNPITNRNGYPTGCFDPDDCIPIDTNENGFQCDGHCPIMCDPWYEVKCDGTEVYHGPQAGCKNADSCKEKARNPNGQFCPDESESHGCPLTCPDEHDICPTLTDLNTGCKEQARCIPCKKNNNGDCCPSVSNCHVLCQPGQQECAQIGEDDNGCPLPRVCMDVSRDFYGDMCPVYCPGECEDWQIYCEGEDMGNGCTRPPFCVPLAKKLWGDDEGEWCPGFCPTYCKDWEQLCESVQDPCDGCPTEAVCKPKMKDENGIYCPGESASHGCQISCKTLDGEETLCAAYDDPAAPACKERSICMARTKGDDGSLCPAHSVCPKRCLSREKQCVSGYDSNGCKLADSCIPFPVDDYGMDCRDFECPPKCDEEVQKYCQGSYQLNDFGQLCPKRDYCIDRPVDRNGLRCPGHCEPECGVGFQPKPQNGADERGCPLPAACEAIVSEE